VLRLQARGGIFHVFLSRDLEYHWRYRLLLLRLLTTNLLGLARLRGLRGDGGTEQQPVGARLKKRMLASLGGGNAQPWVPEKTTSDEIHQEGIERGEGVAHAYCT
jgi:hypothetical protein